MELIILTIYIGILWILSIIVTVYDKIAAKKSMQRISERTLLILAAIGGAAAMLATMKTIRHKTRKNKFMITLPIFMVLQVVAVVLYLLHG